MNDKPGISTGKIPLAETLKAIRRELELARLQSAGEKIMFQMDKVELELQMAISQTKTGSAGIEFWVVKAGGEVGESAETTHTIRFTLTPVTSEPGGHVNVSSQSSEAPVKK